MRLIRSILVLLLLLLVLAVGLLFTIQNDVLVPLNVLVAELPAQRLSTWIILSFFLGGLAGLVASTVVILRLQASRLRLRRLLNSEKTKLERTQLVSS
ncbi:lipopolysaccharide assembly protein LapA domain-containing protein [Zhongshania aliphaticivorans]|uniref:lipopolysaccharide assembly protein LapA domain-containing protein n=1 Tax=Zhongshania aliphaticivorans TaxID=1470434 RepID=UPI0012E5AAFB|nr:lipopolysaccharide assembly protein LapA domain-containing protein [Zhongshania aliphaticivorans]CAA0082774.1 Lipopolysaccharide assembly protein A [Zhongshania aliphaticivorans]